MISSAPIDSIPTTPPCGMTCYVVPAQCYYAVSVNKIIWNPEVDTGYTHSWVIISNFIDAVLYPTIAGDTKQILPDSKGWNPPLVGPENKGWNPPLTKNLPAVIADKITCDCEIIPDYDPVYAKAILYPGIGIGYQRSKIIIVYTDEMYDNQPDLKLCPKRDINYHLHVNRLTERIRINRRTK